MSISNSMRCFSLSFNMFKRFNNNTSFNTDSEKKSSRIKFNHFFKNFIDLSITSKFKVLLIKLITSIFFDAIIFKFFR